MGAGDGGGAILAQFPRGGDLGAGPSEWPGERREGVFKAKGAGLGWWKGL